MTDPSAVTFLFTDIEGSTRLWEADPERMREALAAHDALLREAVVANRGEVVKMIGDGMHAAFAEPLDALAACVAVQSSLADAGATAGIALRVRCGVHVGAVAKREQDYHGVPVNRAARVMRAAHGGQILVSGAVAEAVGAALPAPLALRDLGAVRLKDLALPERVFQLVHPALRRDFPALRSLEATPNNLPQQTSSFVGRERELGELRQLLKARRLVTLAGIGGIGKTRLALQLAAEALEAFVDGVWLVELAPIGDALLVPSSAAQVLGIQERAGAPLGEALARHLQSRCALLILDNCEHVLDACADLAGRLLAAAPELRILATSREPLNVAGEQTFPVPPLSLPAMGIGAEALSRAEAAQLFVERIRLQQPHFALTERHARAIAELCTHLDGIPLALELAAARAHTLSIDEINARLDDRFRLLTGGSRTAMPRQQTLRATLDWSYGLLEPDERAVFDRLAVFAGGFTLEAAAAVAGGDGVDDFAMIDLLARLVARSLVVADASAAATRYRLLETTRAYALEKLAGEGAGPAIARRHAAYLRDFFDRAMDDWLRIPDAAWRARYLPERDNVRAALDWALSAGGDPALAVALAGGSAAMWPELSLHGEGQRRLEAAAARVTDATPEGHVARLWLWLGMQWTMAAPSQAHPAFERAIALYRRLGDRPGLGFALVRLAHELAVMSRYDGAAAALAEARPLLLDSGPPKAVGDYYDVSGMLKALTEDPVGARADFESALSTYRDGGADRYAIFTLGQLADMAWALGDLDAALGGFRETILRLRGQPMTNVMLGYSLGNLAGVLTERGDLGAALDAAREGLPLLRDSGYAWVNMDHLALRSALAGDHAGAARIAGYVDALRASKAATRQPNEARAYARAQEILRGRLPAAELERLHAEGARMTEDEVCRLAAGAAAPEPGAPQPAGSRPAEGR